MKTPPFIYGIGKNYADHTTEMGELTRSELIVFAKNPASIIQNGEPIIIPRCCKDELDFEGELAVRINEDCKNISADEAHQYIDGYAVANDVTARRWQKELNGGQWLIGKGFDTFCPLSKFIKVKNPGQLSIRTFLNDVLMQESNTKNMIRNTPTLISELSQGTTLFKGCIILTGTPGGVGHARTPRVFLKPGDIIRVEIESVGILINQVQGETI